MAFIIVEFENTKEVNYLPWIWLNNLYANEIGQKIKGKTLVECCWPPAYLRNISKAKDSIQR